MTSSTGVGRPKTNFLYTPRGEIAYQVFGSGDRDLVYITHWMANIDMFWHEPSAVRFFDRLATMGRVILIDKLGSGVSDVPEKGVLTPIEDHLDDIRDVLDETGSRQATLIGDTEGGMLAMMLAMMLAAIYPDQFPRLVLINSYARLSRAEDYPIGAPPSAIENMKTAAGST